jgi:hypothetical protein
LKISKIYEAAGEDCSFPDFLILGTMRGGTTSLYHYLQKQPQVKESTCKEIHYFDNNYHMHSVWYRRQFHKDRNIFPEEITGEATPSYLSHPAVPKRVYELLPNVKLIVLLRDPVRRAYSNYLMNIRKNREYFTFEQAIDVSESYKDRGCYAEQLKRWFVYFKREQFLILKSEDFFDNPKKVTMQVCEFLKIESYKDPVYKKWNCDGFGPDIPVNIKTKLTEYFAPLNQELYDLLGVDYGW